LQLLVSLSDDACHEIVTVWSIMQYKELGIKFSDRPTQEI